jgi:hypothetical protein
METSNHESIFGLDFVPRPYPNHKYKHNNNKIFVGPYVVYIFMSFVVLWTAMRAMHLLFYGQA